jgi:spoIIIJ-associated protein
MEPKRVIETTGDTVEAAIQAGLTELNVQPNQVIIEVIDEPSRGVDGHSVRLAKVRLQVLFTRPAAPPPRPVIVEPPRPPARDSARDERGSRNDERGGRRADGPRADGRRPNPGPDYHRGEGARGDSNRPRTGDGAPRTTDRDGARPNTRRSDGRRDRDGHSRDRRTDTFRDVRGGMLPMTDFEDFEDDDSLPIGGDHETVELSDDQISDDALLSRGVLQDILDRMGVQARVSVRRVETTRETENTPWLLNIVGSKQGGMLVGKRGDTLAALQYLTRLIASRRLQHRANVIVDVENYKTRRSDGLRTLAERLAAQALAQQRIITMEPMPPHERRIIHLILRDHPQVITKSVGEGDRRKVTIVPRSLKPRPPQDTTEVSDVDSVSDGDPLPPDHGDDGGIYDGGGIYDA